MRKGETGQAFILVLILLAIGALLIVPALRLTGTSLKSSQILARQVRAMYAADGAQEYVLWKLAYQPGYAASFTVEGQSDNFTVNLCGKSVDVSVVMRAVPGLGGMTLATDDAIRPTKSVDPNTVPDASSRTYTYTIRLEQLSENTTQGLDAVYDILPKDFGTGSYVPDSSYLSVDGGAWEPIGNPLIEDVANQDRLRWPASGNFTEPMRDFAVRQVKEIKFQVSGALKNNRTYYNWVVLKPWHTLSGGSGTIIVGDGSGSEGGVLDVTKASYPEVIQPGVETDIEYTISITNLSGHTMQIQEITDYLPPGFTYSDNSTSGITFSEPQRDLENLNGVDRWVLLWGDTELPGGQVQILSDETLTLTFWGYATKDVSGSYYNEVTVVPNEPLGNIFSDIGVTYSDFNASYSWNTGTVIVPAYDSRTDADGVLIDANMALTLDSISITSWQIY